MRQLTQIRKQTLIKRVKESKTPIDVRIVSSKLYPVDMWSFDIELIWDNDRGVIIHNSAPVYDLESDSFLPATLDHWLNQWSYYNTDSERGYYAHYYV
jgi:hypothetical protein